MYGKFFDLNFVDYNIDNPLIVVEGVQDRSAELYVEVDSTERSGDKSPILHTAN